MSRIYPCVYCTEDGYCEKYSDEEVTSWCVQGPCKDERPSNADRIRAMTDEELAEHLARLETKCYLRFLPHWKCNTENFAKQWLDWLKQEVDDE